LIVVKLVQGFDIVGNLALILDDLFEQTCNKVRNFLLDLFFIVAIDACYGNIIVLEDCLEMVYHDGRKDGLASTRHSGTPQRLRYPITPLLKFLAFEKPLPCSIFPFL